MGKRILITGVGGFVGKNLVRFLSVDADNDVVGIDLLESFKPLDNRSLPRFRYQSGNLWQKELIEQLMAGERFDIIIHLAAILSQADDFETHCKSVDSNMKASFLVMELAKAHGARIIFPSTALIYGDQKGPFSESMEAKPADFYSFSKHLCEKVILYYQERFGIRPVIFRPAILYGPGQSGTMFIPALVKALLQGKEFPMTKGEQYRDFVYIGDFVEAVGLALQNENLTGIYNIGTGTRWKLVDAALLAEKLVGAHGRVKAGALSYRANESWDYCVSHGKILQETGWKPNTGLENGLGQTIEWWKKNPEVLR